MKFRHSPAASLGMELELQLIDPKTFDLVDGILPLMACYPPYPWIKPEYNQATVEIMSKVCTTIQDLEMHMHAVLSTLQQRCQGLGMTLCSAGTHPFCSRPATMTPIPRHLVQYQMAGFLANWTTFALHVHVGMPSGDEAVAVMGKLKPYLPILLALSANSPLWWGCDTSYASFRQRLLATRKAYGLPPTFKSWQAFDDYFTVTRHAKMFGMVRDIHWDLRLQPELGTLEVRVMDAPTTLKEALMLAAFVHTLVMYVQHHSAEEYGGFLLPHPPWWTEKENYFRASRLGLEANYILDEKGHSLPIKTVIMDILDALQPTANELSEADHLTWIKEHLDTDPGYARQRRVLETTGSAREVVRALAQALETDLLDFPVQSQQYVLANSRASQNLDSSTFTRRPKDKNYQS